jgi:hypothetical protein
MTCGTIGGGILGAALPFTICSSLLLYVPGDFPILGPFGPFFLGIVRYVHRSSVTWQFAHGCSPSQRIFLEWQQSHACLTFESFLRGFGCCESISVHWKSQKEIQGIEEGVAPSRRS